jgi:superfamily II DNA or RNA helicase
MQLRPYQQEALTAIDEALARGVRRQLLALPTGGGKTVVFSELVRRRPGRALILAHRDRLIQQAHDKLATVIEPARLGIVKADQNHFAAQTIVASVQTLARPRRRQSLPKFDTIIIDEAHRSAARVYREIIDELAGPDCLLLGVTATPERSDGVGLDTVYDEIVYQVGILDLIEAGYLIPLRGRKVVINADFSHVHTCRNTDGVSDYKTDEIEQLMQAANWCEHIGKAWLEDARDRRTIAFVPRVRMAYQLAEWLTGNGIAAAALDGSSHISDQRRVVRDFEAGRIQFLANCDLFVEGADIPSINCVVFARPTKSRIVYSQAIGRGTRLSPETGKTDCLVLDVAGATNRFDLCHLGTLAGVNRVRDDETLAEAVEREEKEAQAKAEAVPPPAMHGDLRLVDADLFVDTRHRSRHSSSSGTLTRSPVRLKCAPVRICIASAGLIRTVTTSTRIRMFAPLRPQRTTGRTLTCKRYRNATSTPTP